MRWASASFCNSWSRLFWPPWRSTKWFILPGVPRSRDSTACTPATMEDSSTCLGMLEPEGERKRDPGKPGSAGPALVRAVSRFSAGQDRFAGGGRSRVLADLLEEFLEQIVGILGSGRGLGMVLNRVGRQAAVAQARHGPIIEVDMGHFDLGFVQGAGIHGEPMVLGGYLHLARAQILYGMVRAAMPELELEGFSAQEIGQQLVAEADSENRLHPEQGFDGIDGIIQLGRVAGAVGEEYPVRIEGQDFFGRGGGGNAHHLGTHGPQFPKDVVLDAVIDRGDLVTRDVVGYGAEARSEERRVGKR